MKTKSKKISTMTTEEALEFLFNNCGLDCEHWQGAALVAMCKNAKDEEKMINTFWRMIGETDVMEKRCKRDDYFFGYLPEADKDW